MIETIRETCTESVQVSALTSRGVAACRLSDFADQWATLNQADRAWFAEWLTTLLVDACQEPAALR